MKIQLFAILSVILLASSSMGKTPSPGKDIGTLTIGAIFPLSGSQAVYGNEALAALNIAMEHLKAKDPQTAARIRVIPADDNSTSAGAAKAANELVAQRVSILLGTLSHSGSKAIAKVAAEHQKPLIIPSVTSNGFEGKGAYVFRSCFDDAWHGKVLASFAKQHLNASKAAILADMSIPYSEKIAQTFKESFLELGGTIVSAVSYKRGEDRPESHLSAIAKMKPEIVLFPSPFLDEVKNVLRVANKLRVKAAFLGPDSWDQAYLSVLAQSPTTPIYYSVQFSALTPTPAVQALTESFKRRVNRLPSALAGMVYDAFTLIVNTYGRVGSDRSELLLKGLMKSPVVDGLAGPMVVNGDHVAEKFGVVLRHHDQSPSFEALVHPYQPLDIGKNGTSTDSKL